MSYQVLARKYRPRNFTELVGQEHVSKALIHALENNRLHHAYLFAGTRGCGKTTIARILAKCLNCETGITATPCETCTSCQEISAGRFVDLIEVDAASRTRVEDTRELLDNVQYAPSRGRFKVYLIDEVHMLSTHSFNALLKTLEEPPEHVKFLFATTDPQKLPVTILSRCLQFNLTELSPSNIQRHLVELLTKEGVAFEEQSLLYLGEAAKGSLRDALSLTDQAIAFSAGQLTVANVTSMLGTVDRSHVYMLLRSLAEGDAAPLLQLLDKVLSHSPNEAALLEEIVRVLHRLAVAQAVPQREQENNIQDLAGAFTPEQLQLYYDIAVRSRRDFNHVPDGRVALEMLFLRMLLFRPDGVLLAPGNNQAQAVEKKNEVAPTQSPALAVSPPAADVEGVPASPPRQQEPPQAITPVTEEESTPPWQQEATQAAAPEKSHSDAATPSEDKSEALPPQARTTEVAPQLATASVEPSPETLQEKSPQAEPETVLETPTEALTSKPELPPMPGADDKAALAQWWEQLIKLLPISGVVANLASNCQLKHHRDNRWVLALHGGHDILAGRGKRLAEVQQAVRDLLHIPVQLEIEQDDAIDLSPDMIRAERKQQQLAHATATLQQDPVVKALLTEFDATLHVDTIVPTINE